MGIALHSGQRIACVSSGLLIAAEPCAQFSAGWKFTEMLAVKGGFPISAIATASPICSGHRGRGRRDNAGAQASLAAGAVQAPVAMHAPRPLVATALVIPISGWKDAKGDQNWPSSVPSPEFRDASTTSSAVIMPQI